MASICISNNPVCKCNKCKDVELNSVGENTCEGSMVTALAKAFDFEPEG